MDATHGFLDSRHDAFEIKANRKLFHLVRPVQGSPY